MPTIQIPTVSQAESKQRICEGFLHILEIERYRLELDHQDKKIDEEELKALLQDIAADEERLQSELESSRIIHRTTSAA